MFFKKILIKNTYYVFFKKKQGSVLKLGFRAPILLSCLHEGIAICIIVKGKRRVWHTHERIPEN